MIQLRPFQATDLETLYRIDQVCFPSDISYSRNELRYYLQYPKSFTVVAVNADKIVGFCIGQAYLQEGKQIGHIITIDVLPTSRREGTGRLLFRTVEEHFRAEGAVIMQLEVAADNHPAQSFYQAMGYEQIGKLPGYYNNKLDAVVMEKQLSVA